MQVVVPDGNGDELKITWNTSQQPTREMLVGLVRTMSPRASLRESIAVEVAGSASDLLVIDLDGKGNLLVSTQWGCPDDPRTFTLFSHIAAPLAAVTRLHRRVLESIHCEDPPSLAVPYPELDEPGLQRREEPGAILYATADGEWIAFSSGLPDANAVEAFTKSLELRRAFGQAFAPSLDSGAFKTSEARGPLARQVWRGTGRDPTGVAVHVVLVPLPCPGRAFVGFHVSTAPPRDEILDLLVSARCPA